MKRKQIQILIIALLLTGCFSIRTPFIPTQYYTLNQQPFSFKNIAELETFILFKDFSVPEELVENKIMVWFEDGSVQKYNYHRFTTDYPELINNFIFTRLNLSKAFKYGISNSSSTIVPNFILEGKVFEFRAYSDSKDKSKNWVNVAIQVNLLKYVPITNQNKVVLSKVYTQKVERSSREVATIPQAFSIALSTIVDKMLIDLQTATAEAE
jgi:ABC-type uncharacterized transport system auxiliary subunit